LTRGKIAASWFSDLTRNRTVSYLILFTALTSFVLVVAWRHTKGRPEVIPLLPVSKVITEYRTHTHGPMTILVHPAPPDSEAILNWVTIIANDQGELRYQSDQQYGRKLSFMPFDTIKIQYFRYLYLISYIDSITTVFSKDTLITPTIVTQDSTAIYQIGLVFGPNPDTTSAKKTSSAG
jgi:hypothetical protein